MLYPSALTGTSAWLMGSSRPVRNAGETLEATCDFDSRTVSHTVRSGTTHHDEMCNLYFMMWTEMPVFLNCYDHARDMSHHGPGVGPGPLLQHSLQSTVSRDRSCTLTCQPAHVPACLELYSFKSPCCTSDLLCMAPHRV